MTTTPPDVDRLLDEAAALHEQGGALASEGNWSEAEARFRESLAIFQEHCGAEHPDVANVLNALGVALLKQSRTDAARRCFRRAWRIAKRSPVAPRPDRRMSGGVDFANEDQETLNADSALGFPVAERQGYVERDDTDDSVARIAVQALSNLGHLEREAGNWGRAGGILNRAVRLARERLGEHDLDVANSLNNLGMWCKFTGRFERGRRCYRRAMSILRRHCGPGEARRSPDIACIYHNMAGLEHTAGNFATGEPFAHKSVTIRRRAVGTEHFDYASDIGGLAAIVADLGRCDEAEALYREALAIFERLLGDDHYEIAVLLHNLAAVEVTRERLDSAWDLYQRSAAMKERWLGSDHPDLALTLHNLAVLAYDMKRLDDARTLCHRALAIFQQHLVETHPTFIACRELAEAVEG